MSAAAGLRAVVAPRLEPLEVASGVVLGRRRVPLPPEADRPPGDPRKTLETLLLGALRRPPCVVAFSGGRDSSAVLAEATRIARAHGLDDPVPFTMRFGEAPRTAEGEWQELVIDHLGLSEWSRRQVTDELDALGDLALAVLNRHGVHWPPNAHTFELWLEAARGGSLVTGNGGDELFSAWSAHRAALLRRARTVPRRSDLRALAVPLLPLAVLANRPKYRIPWLRDDARRAVGRGFAAGFKRHDRSWREMLERHLESRYREVALWMAGAMAVAGGVHLVEPFFDREYMRAVAADAPAEGYTSRAAAMQRHFGDVLPAQLAGRVGKASFTEVFVGERTRDFAAAWDGHGLDDSLVDCAALRSQWLSARPDMRSLVPLQAAWLAGR